MASERRTDVATRPVPAARTGVDGGSVVAVPVPGTAAASPVDPAAVRELGNVREIGEVRFGIPDLPSFHISRRRLVERFAGADTVPLVLVSAPAGTGKTSLVAEWVRSGGAGLTGWVTVDGRDATLWGSVVGCLRRLGMDVPRADASDVELGRSRLVALAGEIVSAPRRLTVVLDGYELASLQLAGEVDFLLRNTFGKLRLVLVGRTDPVLPLYRYRLDESLVEVRAADLAFTDEEAARLARRSGVNLSATALHDLNVRCRGWAAGLRFAALALAGRRNPEASVPAVVAETSDINEYLTGEVLDAQPPEVRRFLLYTSLPEAISTALATELAGPGAGRTLGELVRSDTFLEPVPERPGWYSYHPFFRDLLRARLGYESPQAATGLHRAAARWFGRYGHVEMSVRHLADVGAWDEVADQIVKGLMTGRLLLEQPDGPLRDVAERMPEDLDAVAPRVVRAAAALASGDRLACEAELAAARTAADTGPGPGYAGGLSIAVIDALRGCLADDARTASRLAGQARRAVSGTRPGSELAALAALSDGVATLRAGDPHRARRLLAAAADLDVAGGYGAFRAECLGYLALVEALAGQLSQASRTASDALDIPGEGGVLQPVRSVAAQAALACVALEQYDLPAAARHVATAAESPALRCDPVSSCVAEGVTAGIERAHGDLRALGRLETTARELASADPWLARYLRLEAARLSIASGHADRALSALRPLGTGDDPEVAAVTAAAYAEQGEHSAAADFLVRARNGQPPLPARVAGLLAEVVEESRNRAPGRTRMVLNRSLRLAAPEELRRPFREAGPAAQRLLSADPQVLADNRWLRLSLPSARPGDGGPSARVPVVEPLTAKEREVLGHLEELLTTEEIASRMYVSVNTVRTHIRSILRKLGVSRRNAAVRKARQLGLC